MAYNQSNWKHTVWRPGFYQLSKAQEISDHTVHFSLLQFGPQKRCLQDSVQSLTDACKYMTDFDLTTSSSKNYNGWLIDQMSHTEFTFMICAQSTEISLFWLNVNIDSFDIFLNQKMQKQPINLVQQVCRLCVDSSLWKTNPSCLKFLPLDCPIKSAFYK